MSEQVKENLIAEESAVAERERKQFVKMTRTPIPRLIISLGIPTMLSMMVTSLYNLADTYFVSLLGNDAVTAAVGEGAIEPSRYDSYLKLYEKASLIKEWELK